MDIPQILAIIIFTLQFSVSLIRDGETQEISFWDTVVGIILWNIILYAGGFWN